MGHCYHCDLEKEEDVSTICSSCMSQFYCSIHGPDGDVTCDECKERLTDVIHACTQAVSKKYKKEFSVGIVTDNGFRFVGHNHQYKRNYDFIM